MKYLILTLVFLALGACSSDETDFNESGGTTKFSSASGQGADGAGAGTGNRETASSGTEDAAAMPDKVIVINGDECDGEFPDKVEGTQRFKAVCTHETNKADVREISVIDTKEGHCVPVYSKFGKRCIVGYARNDMNFCTDVYIKIINNLSGYFECEGNILEVAGDGGETGSDDDDSGTGSTSVGGDTEDDGTGDTGDAEPGEDASGGEDGGDPSAPRFMDISTFLEMEQKAVRKTMNCKNGEDEVFVSVIDTVEGPCAVVRKESSDDDEQGMLETVGIEDMSKCDRGFDTLVNQLIRDGFGCNGSGFSATD